jgi:hypothetical protein
MRPQPLICVRDVEASSRWYQRLLGCRSAHGGREYERLVSRDGLILQLHSWEIDHEHGPMGDPAREPYGNGVLLWFELDDFESAVARAEDDERGSREGAASQSCVRHWRPESLGALAARSRRLHGRRGKPGRIGELTSDETTAALDHAHQLALHRRRLLPARPSFVAADPRARSGKGRWTRVDRRHASPLDPFRSADAARLDLGPLASGRLARRAPPDRPRSLGVSGDRARGVVRRRGVSRLSPGRFGPFPRRGETSAIATVRRAAHALILAVS